MPWLQTIMMKSLRNCHNWKDIYRWIHFYVNNPKTADEINLPETISRLLTLFKGGVTVVNRIICIFVTEIYNTN